MVYVVVLLDQELFFNTTFLLVKYLERDLSPALLQGTAQIQGRQKTKI